MSRLRELTMLSGADTVRVAARFRQSALNLMWDCATGTDSTPFPRRVGLFVTNRCDFTCPMCAVQDARDVGLARGGDIPFEVIKQVVEESAPHQPLLDIMGGEPLLYAQLN